MGFLLACCLASAAQDDLAARLRRDGALAAEELGAKPELRSTLESLQRTGDADVVWWAGAALAELDARRDGGKAYLPPRRVTLEAKDRPAFEILQELAALDGDVVAPDPARPLPRIDLSLRDVPIHAAFDEVGRKVGAAVCRSSDGTLKQARRGLPGTPSLYAPLHSFEFRSVEHRTVADFDGPPKASTEIMFDAVGDPRSGWKFQRCTWTFASAKDESGRALEIDSEPAARSWGGVDYIPIHLGLVLRAVPPDSRRVAVLRGEASLTIWKRPESVVFGSPSGGAPQVQTLGAYTVRLTPLAREEGEWVCNLTYEPAKAPGSPGGDQVFLEDMQGRPFLRGGASWSNGHVTCRFRAEANREPARVRVTLYPDLHVRRVRFELKDIPLR